MILYAIIIFGFLIRCIALYQMRKNNVWRILKPVDYQKQGIYKYLRHPMYLGALLIFIPAWYLADNNIWTTLIFGIFLH